MVKLKHILPLVLLPMLLVGCNDIGSQFTCSNDDSKTTTLHLIKEAMEKSVADRTKDEDGGSLAANSAIRAALDQIKMSIENIRTTKRDPNSTMQFCSGSLKIVYPMNILKDADVTREMAGLDSIDDLTSKADISRKADAFESDFDYSIQPTDDGTKVFAQIANFDDKLGAFAEVIASHLLKADWERIKRQNAQISADEAPQVDGQLANQFQEYIDSYNAM